MSVQISDVILRLKQANAYLGISDTTRWRLENNDPRFPNKIRFSSRCVGYRKSDLDAYLTKLEE